MTGAPESKRPARVRHDHVTRITSTTNAMAVSADEAISTPRVNAMRIPGSAAGSTADSDGG
jgi:hypothetical protein